MKTIKIVSGFYGASNGKGGVKVVPCGGTCQVDDREAERLVVLGVAAVVVATPDNGVSTTEPSANPTELKNVSEGEGDNNPNDSVQTGLPIPDGAVIVDGHFTKESLLQMTKPNMEKLAADLGVDVTKCKNKSDIADLLVAVELDEVEIADDEVDDGELPPELEAEVPVV